MDRALETTSTVFNSVQDIVALLNQISSTRTNGAEIRMQATITGNFRAKFLIHCKTYLQGECLKKQFVDARPLTKSLPVLLNGVELM